MSLNEQKKTKRYASLSFNQGNINESIIMPGRTGKQPPNPPRQFSPEIPSPTKITEPNRINDDANIENEMPIDVTEPIDDSSSIIPSQSTNNDLHPLVILLANGQPLLTPFEEKYLVELICKSIHDDLERILREKIPSILQMNYSNQSSGFTLHSSWIFDFLLKHFQILIEHPHASECLSKFLEKKFDQNNSFKHWQLQTLFNEHAKKSSTNSKKRRMTVRHIDFS